MDRLNADPQVDPEIIQLRESTVRPPQKYRFVVPSLLLLVYLAQCAWFIGTQSLTIDEPNHIRAGLEQWRTGQYSGGMGWNDHPPLSRLLCTIPAINQKFQVPNPKPETPHTYPTGDRKTVLPSPAAMAWHTRPVNAVLGAILGLLLWTAARSLYSTSAANLALALFAFSPSLIAHFSLAGTNDGVMALMTFATTFQLYWWRHERSLFQTGLLGLVLGGLLLAKTASLPLFTAAVGLVLILKADAVSLWPNEWNWKDAATVLIISFLVVWGAYRFHVSRITLSANDIRVRVAIPKRPDPIVYQPAQPVSVSLPVPAYEFVQGIWFRIKDNKEGHPGFLLGHSYYGGSRAYFPMTVLLKWPTVVLFLSLVAILMVVSRRMRLPRDFALWAIFPVLYFVFALFTRVNIGERHILPVYPFALLLCAGLWELTKGRRAVLALIVLALAVHAFDVLRYAPDYLSYFNLFVSPTNSYKLLSDSNVDWGEGLIALRKYQQAYSNEVIHLAYSGTIDPVVYGVHALPLMPNQRVSGTVIISANYLSGQTLEDPNSYHWVLQYPRKAILNHSLHVFEVPAQNTP